MGLLGKKELQRTCDRDGTVWFVPLELAKPPSKQAIRAAKVGSFGIGRANVQQNLRAGRLQAERQSSVDASRCPQCGSTSYREVKVKA